MSVGSFHYVQQQTEKYYDMISTDKKKLPLWSRRLHLALLAYRELLHTLSFMDKSDDFMVKESSRVIKSNIFYVMEYRELILTLLVMYDELKMSSAYLNDLIETQHIFIRMLQQYCGRDGQFITQKKGKKKPRKKCKFQKKKKKYLELIAFFRFYKKKEEERRAIVRVLIHKNGKESYILFNILYVKNVSLRKYIKNI